MATRLNPYLNFGDNAREAMEFYRSVFGGELVVMTFAEGGMPHEPAEAGKVMHGQLETPSGYTLMGADTPAGMPRSEGSSAAISLSGDDGEELRGYWGKLSEGATITQPLETAPWGDAFGMLTDKYGTPWLVNISGTPKA
jgi:PhnB protein